MTKDCMLFYMQFAIYKKIFYFVGFKLLNRIKDIIVGIFRNMANNSIIIQTEQVQSIRIAVAFSIAMVVATPWIRSCSFEYRGSVSWTVITSSTIILPDGKLTTSVAQALPSVARSHLSTVSK